MHFGFILTLFFQIILFLPMYIFFKLSISNSQEGISPESILSSSISVSNLLMFRKDQGITPEKLFFLNAKVEMFNKFPIPLGICIRKLLSLKSNLSYPFKFRIESGIGPENLFWLIESCCNFNCEIPHLFRNISIKKILIQLQCPQICKLSDFHLNQEPAETLFGIVLQEWSH